VPHPVLIINFAAVFSARMFVTRFLLCFLIFQQQSTLSIIEDLLLICVSLKITQMYCNVNCYVKIHVKARTIIPERRITYLG
jgi:hypothetical protein